MPPIPPSAVDYDDRPAGKPNPGMVVAIVAVVAVLLSAAGIGYMYVSGHLGTGGTGEQTAQAGDDDGKSTAGTAARAALTIQTTPGDAKITVDGRDVSGESPFVVSDLEAGKHELVVSRDGYLPFEREVDLPASGLNLPITLPHKNVTLVLDSEPAGASMNLVVNGKAVAMGTAGGQYEVAREPGATYEVEASHKGYATSRVPLSFTGEPSQTVRVVLPRDQNVAAASKTAGGDGGGASRSSSRSRSSSSSRGSSSKPKRKVAKTATLRIGTNPGVPPAKVYVDGAYVGKTPQPSVKVTPGSHKVKFEWAGGKTVTQTATVGDSQSKLVKGG